MFQVLCGSISHFIVENNLLFGSASVGVLCVETRAERHVRLLCQRHVAIASTLEQGRRHLDLAAYLLVVLLVNMFHLTCRVDAMSESYMCRRNNVDLHFVGLTLMIQQCGS